MKRIIPLFALLIVASISFAQTKKAPAKTTPVVSSANKFGALAVDRNNGFYYGWSFDFDYQKDAEEKALAECKKKGGNCSIVLSFSGAGCAAYRTIKSNVGTAYGWGVAKTKQEADAIAIAECKKRSKGVMPTNFVWACNSTTSAPLKEIYNAKDEFPGSEIKNIGSAQSVDYSKDGKKLAVGGGDGKIRILSVPSYKLLNIIDVAGGKYSREIQDLAFSPDGKHIAVGYGRDGQIQLWDATNGKLIRTFDKKWNNDPSISFSPDGKYIAANGDCVWQGENCPGKTYVYDVATGSILHTLNGHNRTTTSSSFSADGKTLATTGNDGSVIFWNMETGSKVRSFMGNNDRMGGKFSPDGKIFATLSWDGDEKTKIWDAASGRNLQTFPSHGTYGESLAFYNSSDKLITIGMNGLMILRDLKSGSTLASTKKADYVYWGISVAPNGDIATSGAGGVTIWQVEGSEFKVVKTFAR